MGTRRSLVAIYRLVFTDGAMRRLLVHPESRANRKLTHYWRPEGFASGDRLRYTQISATRA